MSQSAITLAFERWKANATEAQQPVILDEFVLANVPNLDPSKPIDRNEGLPDAKYIMHRQAVNKTGVVNQNAVAYSVTIGAEIGDFDFNWIGLLNKQSGTVAMIVHAPTQRKIKTQAGQQGNVLTRSFLLEYLGASKETAITTPAEMWQIDFTARLSGIDEMQRLINRDKYGVASFFSNGFLVAKAGNQFYVTKGLGYIEGLRAELAENKNITVTNQATKVWVDVSYQGNITSDWDVHIAITVKPDLKSYTDNAGFPHFVFAVASISATGVITDLRPIGTLDAQYFDEALKKHEQSRNHPDATTSVKGFTKLNNQVGSSKTTALTPFGAQEALENYQPKGNYVTTATFNLEVNKKFDKDSVSQYSGNSKELVMSQAVVTSLISERPKKEYVDTELGKRQLKGNYADGNAFVSGSDNKEVINDNSRIVLRKSGYYQIYLNDVLRFNLSPAGVLSDCNFSSSLINNIAQNTGKNKNLILSQYAVDENYQQKGNYADKDAITTQGFSGTIISVKNIISQNEKCAIALETTTDNPRLLTRIKNGAWRNVTFQDKSGEVAFIGDSYTTSQSDGKYQPKGSYADKTLSTMQKFNGAIEATNEIQVSNNDVRLVMKTSTNEPVLASKHSSGEWVNVKVPKKSGVMALISDIEEANIYPWGVLIPWCGATAPDWALVANGSAFNKTTYSKLGQYFPGGRLPDVRANVLRGLDAGRGVDTGRTVLSEQMGNSLLSTNLFNNDSSVAKEFELKVDWIGSTGTNNQGGYGIYQQIEGKNGNETRMRNTAVLWIVRAK